MKFKTILQGEEAVIFNYLGEGKVIKGPTRVFLFRKRLQMLRHYKATQYQYLEVTFNTGIVQHIQGPYEMFHNPLDHSKIVINDAIKIDANHMVIVYRRRKEDHSVERRIVQGPQLFMPQAEEWLHKFSWHGQDTKSTGHMIPNSNDFTQLEVIPNQFYYNVREVRTTDDTILTVKLMVFYELKDVIKMLETTQDPIADMINAVCADVIAFAGKLNFQQFLQGTNVLNDMKSYTNLTQRTERIGYSVTKVVYRGYHASDQLQAMQDSAIQSRTELRLNAELQEQQQKLTDFRLEREQQRSNLMQEMEREKVEHRQAVEKMVNSHDISLRDMKLNTRLDCEKLNNAAKLEIKENHGKEELSYLRSLQELDINLTKYLVNEGPGKVDQELRVIPRLMPKTTGTLIGNIPKETKTGTRI